MVPLHNKEVYFHKYCYRCVYKKEPESSDICNACLTVPVNENSHKPIKFKEGGDKRNAKQRAKKGSGPVE